MVDGMAASCIPPAPQRSVGWEEGLAPSAGSQALYSIIESFTFGGLKSKLLTAVTFIY